MKIVEGNQAIQGSDEWLAWRRTKITSTDAASLMGVNPYKREIEVWQEKTGTANKRLDTKAMARGRELEAPARHIFIKESMINMTSKVIESDEFPWMAASLDGISDDGKKILEIKCPGQSSHAADKCGKIRPYYYAQIQHQLMTTKAEVAYYMSFRPEDEEPCIFMMVDPDREYQEKMFLVEQEFWEKLCLFEFNGEV